jgi:hypothetical protein
MDYIALMVFILIFVLFITLIRCNELHVKNKQLRDEVSRMNDMYYELLYDNSILVDKIEKIKNLNLIDYNNNDYYKELLTVNK